MEKRQSGARAPVLRKNDVVRVTIEDMGHGGEGIGKVNGYPLFIRDAVIGDELLVIVTKTGKSYGYGRMKKILRASSFRVEPRCSHAGPCGGCQLQTLAYEQQLIFKENRIRGNLKRIGGFSDEEILMEPMIGMEEPFRYRNKAQFPVGRDREGRIVAGFYAGRSHRIIECRDCCLGVPENATVLAAVLSWMQENGVEPYDEITGHGIVRHVLIRYGFATKEIMVCLVVNSRALPCRRALIEKLCEIEGMTGITYSSNRENTNVIMGETYRTVWGASAITDRIGPLTYRISPLSFFQVNPVQTGKLYGLVLAYAGLTGKEIVWDLYCGIGTISLFLAQRARSVYGVEIVPAAIADARHNAALNGIDNVEFFVGKAEEVVPEKFETEGTRADVVVVDPPRKGCDEKLLKTILAMEPERIVYVSCDTATLARDLKILCGYGYQLERVRGVDQFPQTVHVETVVSMSIKNKKPDHYLSDRNLRVL